MKTLETLNPGDMRHGFSVVRVTPVPGMNMTAVFLRHGKSGAHMLHLAAGDPENLFSIAFRTPPPDDTGLPHILEHSVLCGSKRYPVKDPFVELLKTSLATFLNAFTYPDRTIYPCSSMNARDFQNLMRVYCDAAFFPILSEDHFRQEGHHFEFAPDGSLTVKGVVYNEMRGVYSDPESILDRRVQAILFESNAYGRDYGGDPKAIPQLTYRQYLDFHSRFYHPSNAWIFTYGDAELSSTLEILDGEYLGSFDAIALDSAIRPLVRWTEPRSATFSYPLDADAPESARTDVAVAFAANNRGDVLENLAMKTIDAYLLDNAASPLRKALIDSRLGEELGGSGHADYQRDAFFIVTLKGSEADRAEAVEKLILETVEAECVRGFDRGKVESALHRLELASREINPQYPLRLLDRVFSAWLYDSDPLEQVDISGCLDALRAALGRDPRFLESVAEKWIVHNRHRLRITLVPDKRYIEKSDREHADAMAGILAAMSEEDKKRTADIAERLEAMQSAGNSPEALATLPRLGRKDVSPEPLPLEYAVELAGGRDLVRVPLYSGGIGYCNMSLVLSGLDDEDVMLLPTLCEALEKSGAAGLDYADMAAREAAATGALDFSVGLLPRVDGADLSSLRLTVWLKALDTDWDAALGILSDRLFRADFGDRERLRDILLQNRMYWRDSIVPSGNAYAALYAASRVSPAQAMAERLTGCTQARYADGLAARADDLLGALPDRLSALRERVLAGATPSASFLCGDASYAAGRAWFDDNAARFGGSGLRQPLPAIDPGRGESVRIGLAAPADVAYAARVLPAPAMTDPDAAALVMLGVQLSYGYLWNEVRVKGGAYGVRAALDGGRGTFAFSSFRDPNIVRTLDSFSGVRRYVAEEMDLSPDGLEQAVIGAIKTLDAPMRPPTAVATALMRHLGGETEEFRRVFRTRLLHLDAGAVRSAASRLFAGLDAAPVCVLSSREKIVQENGKTDKPFAIESLWEGGA